MPKSDFIPTADHDLTVWLDHFLARLSADPGAHGLSEGDLEPLRAATEDFHRKVTKLADANAEARRATADKDASRDAVEAQSRELARRVKGRPDYSEAEGAELGIVGHKGHFDPTKSKPNLSGRDQTGGLVNLEFNKYGSDGIHVYGQREGDADWVLIGRATVSPFQDTRPLLQVGKPELRRYSAIYMLKDKEVGLYSDEFVISCAP